MLDSIVLMFSSPNCRSCQSGMAAVQAPLSSSSMSGWMAEMADVVDAAQAGASAPPVTKAALPRSMMSSSIDDTLTEPATSPRMLDSQVREWPMELQRPTREIGPREDSTRFIVNGQWTPEEYEEELRKASQAWNQYEWDRRAREAALREKEEHDRSVEEWKAQVEGRGFTDLQLFHLDHLQKRHRLGVFFQMFTKLSGRMILLWLQGHNQSSRKLLHHQEDRGQKLSIQRVNLQGLVQPQCSLHRCPASRYLPSIDSYSHDSRQSTSSTCRGTSKASADRDESGDTQASIASSSSTGSA